MLPFDIELLTLESIAAGKYQLIYEFVLVNNFFKLTRYSTGFN